uniref:Uncharacterized protein n=1 Tax=Oryza barthii TaxID=65489 RepID=A0A0D3G3Z9_9ORYZ
MEEESCFLWYPTTDTEPPGLSWLDRLPWQLSMAPCGAGGASACGGCVGPQRSPDSSNSSVSTINYFYFQEQCGLNVHIKCPELYHAMERQCLEWTGKAARTCTKFTGCKSYI